MATIKERLSEQMKSSMKSGDKETLAFVRNLHAQVRKKEIDDKVDLDDAGVQKIIQSSLKQRQDSLEQFKTGGREDLAVKEEADGFSLSTKEEKKKKKKPKIFKSNQRIGNDADEELHFVVVVVVVVGFFFIIYS